MPEVGTFQLEILNVLLAARVASPFVKAIKEAAKTLGGLFYCSLFLSE
jgi:hypothetical protein